MASVNASPNANHINHKDHNYYSGEQPVRPGSLKLGGSAGGW